MSAPRRIWASRRPEDGWADADKLEGRIGIQPPGSTLYVLGTDHERAVLALRELLSDKAGEAIFGIENCLPNPVWLARVRSIIAKSETAS